MVKQNVELAQRAVNRKFILCFNGFLVANGATTSEFRVSAEAIVESTGLKKKFVE